MEFEGSLPYSQEPAMCSVLNQINPVNTLHFYFLRYVLILSYHLRQDFTSSPFVSGFPTETVYAYLFPPHVLHSLPIIFSMIFSCKIHKTIVCRKKHRILELP
jgi:hypothetical protein